MNHLTNDLLLAYVREQQLYLLTPAMKEHLRRCPFCRSRCMEYKETGNLLEVLSQSTSADSLYSTVATRVMKTMYEPGRAVGAASLVRKQSGFASVRVASIAFAAVLMSVLLFTGLSISIARTTARPTSTTPTKTPHGTGDPVPAGTVGSIGATPTAVTITPTAVVVSSIVPIGTTGTTATAGTTPTTGNTTATTPVQQNSAQIAVEAPCTSVINVIQNQLHVCGKNFTPGTTVTIEYYVKGSTTQKHIAQVDANGTFNDMLYIQACDNVPDAIYVQNTSNPQEKAQITHNIAFGTCQSFGGLKKNK